ncbi:DUF3667 domain-containing protein [Telluribacter sp.]|jgi:hypothetical protein|uniref:DUF3667 domain-containing protein n=1 Tax=Telluribacter sp. TaxID=1978767 RepID=UPI002E0D47FA|nr:DUF3667 domain-containing protein [Telluribacter sp.]
MNQSTCPNCGGDLQPEFKYCAGCGQSAQVHRLDLHHIMHDMMHAVLHADKGIIHLTKAMLLAPGIVAREYVGGKRKKYFNPFSYLVITVAISAFLTAYFHLMQADVQSPNPVSAMVTRHINLIFFVAVPISSFFTWLLFKRSGYNFAENLTFHAFLGGLRIVFFVLIFTPMVVFFREHYYTGLMVYMGIWAAFTAWAYYQFYGGRLTGAILKSFLALFLTQLTISVLLLAIVKFFVFI